MSYGCTGWVTLRVHLTWESGLTASAFAPQALLRSAVRVWVCCRSASAERGAGRAGSGQSPELETVTPMASVFYPFVLHQPPTAAGQNLSDGTSQLTELELLPRKVQRAESPA